MCLYYMVFAKGEIIIFAPHRSGTLSQFIGKAKEAFHVQITEQYDGTLWDYHQQVEVSQLDCSFCPSSMICLAGSKKFAISI